MFFSLQQSAFLHALGSAIGNSLWQLAALWLAFAAITGLAKMNATNRYRLAVLFSATGFLWFVCSLVITYISIATDPGAVLNSYENIGTPLFTNGFSNNVSFVYHSLLASLISLSPYISCAYLLVFALLATRLVNGFRQVKQFGTQGLGKVDIDLRLFVQQHAALLQIQKKVRIFTSEYVQSPLTIGFFKPLILLPIASMSHLSPAQVEAILLHELAHIKRHDYLVNIFVQVAEITLFFNPFMRLMLKQIKQERENCCDDYVLQFQYSAADYAKALLGIAQNRTATLLAMGAKNNQFQLLNRVKRMVAPQPQTFNYRQQLYMLCLVTILGLGITMIVPNNSTAQAKKEPVANKQVEQTPSSVAINTAGQYKSIADDANTDEPEEATAPKAFDVVKTIERFNKAVSSFDTDEIAKAGKEMDTHSKEIAQHYEEEASKALQAAQPAIKDAEAFAKRLAENMATTKSQKALESGSFNEILSTVLDNVKFSSKEYPHPVAKPENPVPPTPPISAKIKMAKQQLALERKMLMNEDQLQQLQSNQKRTMDSLQAALEEMTATKAQESINKVQAKLAAIKSKESWDIPFNQNENISSVANHFATNYTNKVGKMIKKLVADITTDCDFKELGDIQIQIKGDLDKIQSDKINIQFNDKHLEKTRRKNTDANIIITTDNTDQGS